MATSGPNYPGTVEQIAQAPENAEAWVNASNIGADDGSAATITADTFDLGDFSNILLARNFGFALPTDATLDGIVVEIGRSASAGSARDGRVQLRAPSGAFVGDFKNTTTLYPGTEGTATYGGAADTWNAGLSMADLNSIQFGVLLSVEARSADTDVAVDFIRVTVHYTEAASTDRRGVFTWEFLQCPDPAAQGQEAETTLAQIDELTEITEMT